MLKIIIAMLNQLPEAVQELLFGEKLDVKDVCHVACTCKSLSNAASSNKIWKKIYFRQNYNDFQVCSEAMSNWKQKIQNRNTAAKNWEAGNYITRQVNGFYDGQNEQICCLTLQGSTLFAGTRIPQKQATLQQSFLKIWNLESGALLHQEVWAEGANLEHQMIADIAVRGKDLIACNKDGRVQVWTLPDKLFSQTYTGNQTCYSNDLPPPDSNLQIQLQPLFNTTFQEFPYMGKVYIFQSKNEEQSAQLFAVQTEEGWNQWPQFEESENGENFKGELWTLDRTGNVVHKLKHENWLQGFYIDCDNGIAVFIQNSITMQVLDLATCETVCTIAQTEEVDNFLPLDVFVGHRQIVLQALVSGLQSVTVWGIPEQAGEEATLKSKVMFLKGNLEMLNASISPQDPRQINCLLIWSQYSQKSLAVLDLFSGNILASYPPDSSAQFSAAIKREKPISQLLFEANTQFDQSFPDSQFPEQEEEEEEIEEINNVQRSSDDWGHHNYGNGKCQCTWCQMMPSPSIPSPDFPSPDCPTPPFFDDEFGPDDNLDIEQLKQLLVDYNILTEQEAEELEDNPRQQELELETQKEAEKIQCEKGLRGQFMSDLFHDQVKVISIPLRPRQTRPRVHARNGRLFTGHWSLGGIPGHVYATGSPRIPTCRPRVRQTQLQRAS
eukprot:TRINITY_DN304_c1_g1_i9.p1 TRINITY_DN304_c1_g1~~TRINITY_DN304_c1_g1_i9.p1  ORF type:complete len:666 (-),score=66.15 TRINITY_DN304_c1_g1_i9:786-2783(-)